MHYLILTVAAMIGLSGHPQTNIRISGKVYYESMGQQQQQQQQQKVPSKTVAKKTYPADFKVILFKSGSLAMDQQYAKENKKKICANDPDFIERFSPQIVYTDKNGFYEFKNLTTNADYILLFCDTQIQISVISTKSKKNITYAVKDKKIVL